MTSAASPFVRQRFRRLADALAANPYPPESDALRDKPDYRRIWIDRFRLVYRVNEETGTVWILRAGLKGGPEFHENLPDV